MAPLLDHKIGDAMLSSLPLRSKSIFLTCSLILVIYLTSQPALAKPSSLKEITDGNWEDILTGEWMIEFFAPWCPACQQLQPMWNEFADWGEDMGVNIAKVDVTEQPGMYTLLPCCKDGVFRRYQGARTKDDFLSFIDEKKWQGIEPVSSWFGPSSFMMNTMSALFKLSMFIRRCHNYLTEQLGIPVWGSYIIFGLATLFSGLALGLVQKQTMEQARLIQQLEEEQEADGEEDDDEDDEDGEQEEVWRRVSPGGRPEARGPGYPEEALRKRVVGNREEDEDS
uniref:Thioredoxin-related transmembrane protein 1 n=1 Tax=Salmo trutta TaxID=8032 RepID=A0A674BNE3_SALTR